jgi:type II secretory ATPase GspE/PulE/Tfp pilus assembly ATPase PilB-like protein
VIPRFISMGVKPFLLAPALNAVIGQRLVRKLCQTCKKPAKLSPSKLAQVKDELSKIPASANIRVDMNNLAFFDPADSPNTCTTCNGLGYKGRLGIYEIFAMNKEIEEAILADQVSASHVEDLARKQGMITMVQDGLLKAMEGLTSVDEVLRVAALDVETIDAGLIPPVEAKT